MKYQIYLKKEASNLIETMARTAGTTPAHLIKILLENMTQAMGPQMEVILNEIERATKDLVKSISR